MNDQLYTFKQLEKLFSITAHKTSLLKAEAENRLPMAVRMPIGNGTRFQRGWNMEALPTIGEKYGFIKKPADPMVISIYTTKGGVGKTTIALNVARLCALHNIKTCVVGIDFQADISNCLGLGINEETEDDLDEVDKKLDSILGLHDLFMKRAKLDDLIQDTDIPTLKFIPETAGIQALATALTLINKREYWLKDHVIDKLKEKFDLIIIDCPPSWNLLVNNALTSLGEKDLLLVPLETKINQYRNTPHFIDSLNSFKSDMKLKFQQCFIPTKYSGTKKLTIDIKRFYVNNIEGCLPVAIKESNVIEEAVAKYLSVQEYKPNSLPAEEMKEFLMEINKKFMVNKAKLN
jgi:chromosome partitioning protein